MSGEIGESTTYTILIKVFFNLLEAFHKLFYFIALNIFRRILKLPSKLIQYNKIVIKMYVVNSISFHTFYVQIFKIVVDSWKFSMLLLYILWDDWTIFMISGSYELLHQQFEYILLKPDCYSWWISKMQSGLEDILEERYDIKFCFKHGKKCYRNLWNASDSFWSILHESSMSFWVT